MPVHEGAARSTARSSASSGAGSPASISAATPASGDARGWRADANLRSTAAPHLVPWRECRRTCA